MNLRILETPEDLMAVEALQRLVWPGNETEIVPVHMLRAAVHNGGLVIGAFDGQQLVGFVFGFPGMDNTAAGPRLRHASHMAGIHPDYRDSGLGFALKRAQWQMVRQQGLDQITWTYDPLLSRNANLNIAKLGAVCNTYIVDYYGKMRDGLNVGLPSDRFQVDWWVNSKRVTRRLDRRARPKLDLAHYLSAAVPIVNATSLNDAGLVTPHAGEYLLPQPDRPASADPLAPLLLLEIPADFLGLKAADPALALNWRLHTRQLFSTLFALGYLVTDFIYLPGSQPRSYYVFSYGETTL
jgi:predicted GNAT superfamily acetyltransferase